jgi:SAM-dependent methyltransferase
MLLFVIVPPVSRTKFPGISGINDQQQLRAHIIAKGCYDAAENERIYKKWFTQSRPRDHVFAYVDKLIGLTEMTIVDVGCAYGMNLVYSQPGSYGLELEEYPARFARSIGLPVHTRNIISDDLSDLPQVDLVWCAATLEHVDAPHVFLRRLYYLLKPNGKIVLEVPCAMPAAWMRRIPGAEHVYADHDDHINAFSPTSLARMCERAGFSETRTFRYSTPLINRKFPVWATRLPLLSLVANSIVYIGRQVPEWDYPPKASRRAANNTAGYTFRPTIGHLQMGDEEERRH